MIRYIAPVGLVSLAIGLAALIFALPTPVKADSLETVSGTLIQNVRIAENEGRLGEPISILIENGLISDIGTLPDVSAETVIDGTGLTALPGLIDSHTHSYGTSLEDAARFGVTTMLDMFTDPRGLEETLQARTDIAETKKADLFSAGMLATAPRGHGTQFGVPIETLTSPDQAAAWVEARKAEGSDYIKLVYMPGIPSLPSIDRETAKAVIEAGHTEGLMVVAHISTHDAATAMVEDGIDGLVHIFADRLVDKALLDLAKANEVFIVPTLSVIASVNGDDTLGSLASQHQGLLSPMQSQTSGMSFDGSIPGFSLEIALENVEAFHDAGVPILAGSDAPNPGTAHGLSLHTELQFLVRAGLTPTQALKAATQTPAEIFGLEGRGQLDEGARADLVLVEGNPVEEIGSTLNIRHVLKNGHMLTRAAPAAPTAETVAADMLGDFETDLSSIEGFEWTASTDAIAGGTSEVALSRVEGGAQGSAYSLQVEASVNTGFPFPWSGASVALSQTGSTGPVDISGYTSLSFDMKGTPGTYRVMAFGAGAQGIPPTQTVEITEAWQPIVLAISDFAGLQSGTFIGFAFVAGPTLGESTIYLDNVKLTK